jgi:small basic protein
MPPQNNLDLVGMLIIVLGLVFSPQLAAVLAPYTAVLLGALIGTGWGLKRREAETTLKSTLLFVTLMLGTCLIVTMPVAVYLQRYTGENTYQWLLAPVAFLIGFVGEDWPTVGSKVSVIFWRIVGKKADAIVNADKKE